VFHNQAEIGALALGSRAALRVLLGEPD